MSSCLQLSDRGARRMACLTMVLIAMLLGLTLPRPASATSLPSVATTQGMTQPAEGSGASPQGYSLTPSTTEPYAVCGPPTPSHVGCMSIIVPAGATRKLAPLGGLSEQAPEDVTPSGEGGGFDPKELQEAYKTSATGGSTQTVAIVDAYDDPNAEADLKTYREHYKLYYKGTETACTKANECFRKINQKGEQANYPTSKYPINERTGETEDWGLEISLDLDMVSAICSECHILLVEANNNEGTSLYTSEEDAEQWEEIGTKQKATEISNSWGSNEEWPGETEYDKYFEHASIPIMVAAGDKGYGVSYPAASRYVTSVGGTTLNKAEKTERGWEESVWRDSGGGCSADESKPPWQNDPNCSKQRMDNDVAAVANPESPVSVYDSYEYEESGHGTGKLGWVLLGGTSVATPLVTAVEAHASSAVQKEGAEAFYRHTLFDVRSGSNSEWCGGTYLCTGEEGYDGPTGWGAPDGPLELTAGYHAITEPATSITPTEATLNGYVDPEAHETTYYFEYGKTVSYGTIVPVPNGNAGSGVTWKAVSQNVTGLERETTYHYRLVAHNSSGGTIYGKDQTVTTSFWSVVKTPSVGKGILWGVSCMSRLACIAVGEAEGKSLAESESTLETWEVKSTPSPAGAITSTLEGLSCSTANSCTAVGGYENSSKVDVTLAERWNGTEWTIQSTLNPTGAKQSHLDGVSCPSSGACTAVGWYENSSGTEMALAERWNGTAWSIQSTPNTTGDIEADEVSCPSSSACTAVRSYTIARDWVSLVEHWNGTEWQVQKTPTPEIEGHPASEVELRGVSCVTSTECIAVGQYENRSLSEYWNGAEWKIQSTPNPPSGVFNDLRAVSCISSTACVASGQVDNEAVFAERWNGTEWVIQTMPSSPNFGSLDSIQDISCTEPLRSTCVAVGIGGGVPLTESQTIPQTAVTEAATEVSETEATLNGSVGPSGQSTKYYFEYGPTTSYGSKTSEVSAGSGTGSVKVSHTLTGLTPGTYHFRVVATSVAGPSYGTDGTFTAAALTWHVTSTPNPSGTLNSYLEGVSCKTKIICTAVGSYDTSGTSEEKLLAENWNGSNWSLQTVPEPTKTETAEFEGTSCGSTSECIGVGYYEKSGVYFSLAEIWINGYGWFELLPTEPAGALNSLSSAVSCTAGTTCMAVGWYESSSRVEASYSTQLSGSTWSVKPTPNPSGAKGTFPLGVSCTSSTACTMVGYYTNSSGTELPFSERWNGTEWVLQSVPTPTGSIRTELKSVSCTSSSSCTATGTYWPKEGTTDSFAERWNGTEWTVQSVPQPGETTSNSLDGVSCTTTSACMAVGVSYIKNYIPLADQWNGTEWLTQKPPAEEGKGWLSGGVSCSETRFCVAVGNTGKTFAEVYG